MYARRRGKKQKNLHQTTTCYIPIPAYSDGKCEEEEANLSPSFLDRKLQTVRRRSKPITSFSRSKAPSSNQIHQLLF